MLGNPPPSAGAVRDVNSNAPEVENYEVLELCFNKIFTLFENILKGKQQIYCSSPQRVFLAPS